MSEVPQEHCELFPQQTCHHKTLLVPRLKPTKECTLVPKEICHVKHVNPRVESVPFTTLWCQSEDGKNVTFEGVKPDQNDDLPVYVNPDDAYYQTEVPINDINVPISQKPVTKPPSLRTVRLTPQSFQSSMNQALQSAVAASLSHFQFASVEGLQQAVVSAAEQAVKRTVRQSMERQAVKKKLQTASSLHSALKREVRADVEKTVYEKLRSVGQKMTTKTKRNIAAMVQEVQQTVLQTIRRMLKERRGSNKL